MFDNLAQRMVALAERLEIIAPEERELYLYGYGVLISYAINIATALLIGLLFDRITGIMVFLIFFYSLRIFTGGFHASNYMKCYLISVGGIIVITVCEMLIPILPVLIILLLLCLSGVIVLLRAPLQSSNKPMDYMEFRKYRKRARFVYAIQTFSIICGLIANVPSLYIYYSLSALVLVSVLLCFSEKVEEASKTAEN